MSIEYATIGNDIILLVNPSTIDLQYNLPYQHIIFLGNGDDYIVELMESLLKSLEKIEFPLINIKIYNITNYLTYDEAINNIKCISTKTNMVLPINDLCKNINESKKLYHNILFITNVEKVDNFDESANTFWQNIPHELQIQSHILSLDDDITGLEKFASVISTNIDDELQDSTDYITNLLISNLCRMNVIVNGKENDIM